MKHRPPAPSPCANGDSAVILPVPPTAETGAAAEWEKVQRILSACRGEWLSPVYEGAVNSRMPNTALLGNGDVGVSSDGGEQTKVYRLSKGDFWEYNGSPLPIGRITVTATATATAPAPAEAEPFHETQDILHARILTRQVMGGIPLELAGWVAATGNLFVVEIASRAETARAEITVTVEAAEGGGRPVTAAAGEDYLAVTRATAGVRPEDPRSYTSKAALVTRAVGGEGSYRLTGDGSASVIFPLAPGERVFLLTAIGGGGQTYGRDGGLRAGRTEPVAEALALLDRVATPAAVEALRTTHESWWREYWLSSYISLDTREPRLALLQRYYYAARYVLGSGIREGKVAAGLYGIWHTDDGAAWHSDYHLNYNFISTYYPLATANRPSMLLPAVEALMDYLPRGRENAASLGELRKIKEDFVDGLIQRGQIHPEEGIGDGILLPVGIGPWGMTLDPAYHREIVNAPLSAYPLVEYYNYTRDGEFMANTLYVYLRHVLTFLEHWLVEEEGRYVLYAGYNEGSWAVNPALELMAYKYCLTYGIAISERLGVDAHRRAVWQRILHGLAPQPTAENFNGTGRTVLALAESEWNGGGWMPMTTPVPEDGNCIPLEALIPGEVFGYYSTEEELEILRNTVDAFAERGGWTQINNFPKLFTAAVNARYDCDTILTAMADTVRRQMGANLLVDDGVHGIEKAGAAEAIQNMLLLSDKGIVKLFGNWLPRASASFTRLRAPGAFLFSAAYDGEKGEAVEGATMYSEVGETVTVAALWPAGMTVLDEEGCPVAARRSAAPDHSGETVYTFPTEAGRTYTFIKTAP